MDPAPAPAGPISVPMHVAARMVAASETFRVACGLAADDPAAEQKLLHATGEKKRIFYPWWVQEDFPRKLPAAVITWGDSWWLKQKSGGTQNYLPFPEGELLLILAQQAEHPKDDEASGRAFGNFVGQVLRDVADLAAANDWLTINHVEQIHRPMKCSRTEEQSRGRAYWTASYMLHYGL